MGNGNTVTPRGPNAKLGLPKLTLEEIVEKLLAEAEAFRKIGDVVGVVGMIVPGAALGTVVTGALADSALNRALEVLRGVREGLEQNVQQLEQERQDFKRQIDELEGELELLRSALETPLPADGGSVLRPRQPVFPRSQENRPLPGRVRRDGSDPGHACPDDPSAFMAGGIGGSPLLQPAAFEPLPDDTAQRLREVTEAGWLFSDSLESVDVAGRAFNETFVAQNQQLGALADGLADTPPQLAALGEGLEGIGDIGRRAFAGLEGALQKFVQTGKFEWRDFANVALDSISQIFQAQLGASGGGGGVGGLLSTGLTAALGGLFGGGASTALSLSGPRFAFAHGGRPPPGVVSLVGEDGPELFIPDSPGEIVPNDRLGGGGETAMTVNVTQSFDLRGADLAAVAALRREANRIKQEVMAEIINSARRGGIFARMARV